MPLEANSLTFLGLPGAPSTSLPLVCLRFTLSLLQSSWGPLLCLQLLRAFSAKPVAILSSHPIFQTISSKITPSPTVTSTPQALHPPISATGQLLLGLFLLTFITIASIY